MVTIATCGLKEDHACLPGGLHPEGRVNDLDKWCLLIADCLLRKLVTWTRLDGLKLTLRGLGKRAWIARARHEPLIQSSY